MAARAEDRPRVDAGRSAVQMPGRRDLHGAVRSEKRRVLGAVLPRPAEHPERYAPKSAVSWEQYFRARRIARSGNHASASSIGMEAAGFAIIDQFVW